MSLNQKTRSVTLNRECFSLQVLHYLTVVVCFVTEKSMSVKSFKLSCPIVTQVSHPLFSHTHSHSLYTEAPPDASHKATRVWNPLQGLSPEEEDTVDGFLELACSPVMPHAGRNKEFALHTLYQTKGSIKVRLRVSQGLVCYRCCIFTVLLGLGLCHISLRLFLGWSSSALSSCWWLHW